jgi:hypothetical protein
MKKNNASTVLDGRDALVTTLLRVESDGDPMREAKHVAAGGAIDEACCAAILRSVDRIIEHGWVQCAVRVGASTCTLEALQLATDGQRDSRYRMAVAALVRELGGTTVTDWEDKPGRTVEEVLRLLRAVAVPTQLS